MYKTFGKFPGILRLNISKYSGNYWESEGEFLENTNL